MTKRDKTTVDDIIGIIHTDETTNSVEEVKKLRGRENKTEKRFTFIQDTLVKADVFDGDEFVCCTLSVWVEQLVDLLNQLNNENEQLKKDCTVLIYHNQEYRKENEQLKNEIEKIAYANEDLLKEKRQWKKLSDEYAKLSYENEQLKSRVEYLERKIDRERTSYQKQHEKWEEEIQKENEQLKQFIQSLAKQSVNGKVMLRDGKVYDLNKILKKGDVK